MNQNHTTKLGKANAIKPRNIETSREGNDFLIVRKWLTPSAFFLLIFCLIWNFFLYRLYMQILDSGLENNALVAVPLVHLLFGVVFSYICLAMFVNKTTVRVSNSKIVVKHSPLPWLGNKVFNRQEVKQIYCKQQIRRTKNGTSYSYALRLRQQDGTEQVLLKGIRKHEESLYIEQELERYLGIEDQEVHGEY